jgi:transcription elongation GreA/GreB family factor
MLDGLNSVPLSVVGETAGFLSQIGRGKECLDRLAGLVSGRKASVNVLAWCCRNAGHAFGNSVVGPVELALLALEATERVENGERLRSQNQIKRLLQDRTWMKSVCDLMEPSERALFLSRVKTCAGLDSVSARGVMGALVTLYPDMKQHLAGSPSGEDGAPRSARLTSWRSYRDRQEQLRDLVENQIPANSRDIAVARSYGDLRENSEYKYAREQQRLLYRRVEEFERDLKDVRGTDFDGMPSDCCGMGITVELRHPDGRMQVLHILGEWDRDEGMGIISSRSRMAECLAGRKVGDTATVPCETGNEQCIVVRISSLPEAVREWCRGRKKGDSEGVDRGRAAC